jgi:hypothetical protein
MTAPLLLTIVMDLKCIEKLENCRTKERQPLLSDWSDIVMELWQKPTARRVRDVHASKSTGTTPPRTPGKEIIGERYTN